MKQNRTVTFHANWDTNTEIHRFTHSVYRNIVTVDFSATNSFKNQNSSISSKFWRCIQVKIELAFDGRPSKDVRKRVARDRSTMHRRLHLRLSRLSRELETGR